MKKTLLSGVAALLLATGTAHAAETKDMLMVVLKEDDGKKSIHYQMSSDCQKFLSTFRQQKKKGIPVRLKFLAPPEVNGEVIAAYCIHPDGSIEHGGQDTQL
jgi:hypothetical protein